MFSFLLWAAGPSIAVLSFVLFSSFLGSSLYTSCVCFGTFVLWDLLFVFFLCFIIYLFFIDQKKKKKLMSNNRHIVGSIYHSHVKSNNCHIFITTCMCVIRPNNNLPLHGLIFACNSTHTNKHPTTLLKYLHKRGQFSDIVFQ